MLLPGHGYAKYKARNERCTKRAYTGSTHAISGYANYCVFVIRCGALPLREPRRRLRPSGAERARRVV